MKRRVECQRPKLHLSILYLLVLAVLPATARGETLAALLDRAVSPQADFAEFPNLVASYLGTEEQALAAAREQLQAGPSTNQQTGSPATSSGTTNLVDKTGLAELLNLAIERGAIVKSTSGTSFTLQTTPYLIYSKFGGHDTTDTWEKYPALRNLGISASFSQQAGGADQNQGDFESGELKYTWGKRSPRDAAFRQSIRQALSNQIEPVSATANGQLQKFVAGLTPEAQAAFLKAVEDLERWWPNRPNPLDRQTLLDKLGQLLQQTRAKLRPEDRLRLSQFLDSLTAKGEAIASASALADQKAKEFMDASHPEFSLAYSYQRDPTISDFSEVKAIFSYKTGGKLNATFNGDAMFNNSRTGADGARLDSVRAYAIAGDLTYGKFAHDAADLSASVKLMRPQGESHDMAFAETKLNLYIARGVTVPIALTYANRTETSNHSRLRFNIGLSLDADAFLGVARNP